MFLERFKAIFAILGVPILTRDANGNASLSIDELDADIKLGKGKPTPITGSRNLSKADDGCVLVNLTNNAYTLTLVAGLPDGFGCKIIQAGTGIVTVAASGATVNGLTGLKTGGQHAVAEIVQSAVDTYKLTGEKQA